MTDRDALYRAVLGNPEDDTLRLVYADALEESGDPRRAAFVRAHVELSRLPEYDTLWVRARGHGYGRTFDPEWVAELELPDGIEWARDPFRRGLPGAVRARDGAAFVAHADELFTRYPIEALELSVVRIPEAQEFAECPWLVRLVSLSLVQGGGRNAVEPLLASPHLTRLTDLRIGSGLTTTATVFAILRSPAFKRLTAFGMRNDPREGGLLAGELARLSNPPRLKKLDLSGNRLTAGSLAPLVSSEVVAAVEDLDLSENNLGAEGVAVLARGTLPALRSLRLRGTPPQDEGVAALVGAVFFPELRSLALGANNLGPNAALAIANGPSDNLRVLDLSDNRVGDRGAVGLARSAHLPNLIDLDLAEAHVGDAGVTAILDSPLAEQLVFLNLSGSPMSDGMKELLKERMGDRVRV